MHKQLLKNASENELREFIDDAMGMIKETSPDLYHTLENYLYKEIYGCHFCDWLLKEALENMNNEDGTKGAHWTVNDTNQVAQQYGLKFVNFNEYDWNYVMNMIYSDYYGSIPNTLDSYYKVARKFLEDKDAPKGKAYLYYKALK